MISDTENISKIIQIIIGVILLKNFLMFNFLFISIVFNLCIKEGSSKEPNVLCIEGLLITSHLIAVIPPGFGMHRPS